MIDDDILARAASLLAACRAAGLRLATAESCTGGLIAASLTAIPGSSDVVDRGFVTYSNGAKTQMLGVPATMIAAVGAVSPEVAEAMAAGALAASLADLAVSVTGIAGPGGGTPGKPVGLVWFGLARRGHPTLTRSSRFPGDRTEVRRASVACALSLMIESVTRTP